MADKKTYSAQEVAIAVLAKAQQLLGKSDLVKSEKIAQETSGLHTVAYFRPDESLQKSEHMKKGTAQPAPSLAMSEKNPDEKQDAQLGEDVEGLCERHMIDNKAAEKKEGHKLVKMEKCSVCKHEHTHAGLKKSDFQELFEDLAKMEKKEGVDENEIGTKFSKAENKEAPSNSMKPRVKEEGIERDYSDFETKPEHANAPDHREAPQTAPQANPKENAEGNNPPAGVAPMAKAAFGGKGVHKLSHFMGHRAAKNGMKKGIALG